MLDRNIFNRIESAGMYERVRGIQDQNVKQHYGLWKNGYVCLKTKLLTVMMLTVCTDMMKDLRNGIFERIT